jgi:hypothetical protein
MVVVGPQKMPNAEPDSVGYRAREPKGREPEDDRTT